MHVFEYSARYLHVQLSFDSGKAHVEKRRWEIHCIDKRHTVPFGFKTGLNRVCGFHNKDTIYRGIMLIKPVNK
jgi:hypothetical protein